MELMRPTMVMASAPDIVRMVLQSRIGVEE
jgi:hypothetical protein